MADKSPIEWTDATWNPVVGCDIVSPGCTNCYAMKMAARIEAMSAGTGKPTHYAGTTCKVKGKAVWTGKLALAPDHILTQPLRWNRPRMVFVNSMGDLFHESVPDEWIDRVFAVMALAPQHTFQVLTKRAKRMLEYIAPRDTLLRIDEGVSRHTKGIRPNPAPTWPLPNVWLGVSAERQQEADERVPELLNTPAAIRFVSAEPLLSSIDFTSICTGHYFIDALRGMKYHDAPEGQHSATEPCAHLDQIIVGGESGPSARPMHPDGPRSIRDQCEEADVPFFFKQWGEYFPVGQVLPGYGKVHGATAVKPGRMKLHYGGTPNQAPQHAFAERGVEFASTADGRLTFRLGKKVAGRLLDGREHNGMPQPREVPAL
ncbi:DUF5131 family protein [Nitratireductor luteus]|uniref:DUF5131 family protein n=1 Tax=Nitratireductor luteus TaxID=2976980 RepID=UPI00223FB86F|nr:phage Gp37/Gp68 family protein [Nitratireductor luteus]